MSKILIVDDELGIREMLSDILTDEGHTVYTADSAEAARVFVLQDKYDLILLDRMLPGMDGLTLLRQLRREGIHTSVIFLTALGQLSDKTGGLDAGADDYIVKPFAYDELLARIRCVLRRPAVLSGGDFCAMGT